ncbi:MAG: 2Fe-2S iron-sulfur cluster binding domain-containing protein [Bacteroidetes bacterium]|nr:2Fe-2S iron-sulfur cluster binding domain-containing protein [Bacteroidota bacterium]
MARFHKLRIKEITHETPDTVSVVFDVPENLRSEFAYVQGQYLTLKLHVNGEELRRSYSLCSSPVADTEYRIAIKKVKDGRGSKFVNDEMKAGDEVEVMTPLGNFHSPIDASNEINYFLFAGGSGITPMFSILKTVLHSESKSKVTLVYGNRDEQSIIFRKQLEKIVAESNGRLKIIHVLEHTETENEFIQKGLLTKEKVNSILEKHAVISGNNEYFICGPGPMMDNVKNALTEMKADAKRIHIEYFTAVADAVKAAEASSANGNVITSKVTIIMDGQKVNIDLPSNGQAILDAALDADLDVPYACKGAVCCTCRAKLMEGKVTMDQNFALTDDEVAQGYILTCQSHPASERVVVNYDEP